MPDSKSRCVVEISTDCRPLYRPTVDWVATDYQPSVDRLSSECRPLSRSTLPRVNKIQVFWDRGNDWLMVILLQIVMVSLGTHLVKNCESQSKKWVWHWKCLGLYVTRPVNLKTDSKTLYYWQYTEIKIWFFYLKTQQRLKEIYIVTQMGHFYK